MSTRVIGPMFHGTAFYSADGILHEGERMGVGVLGRGFYTSRLEPLASRYAESTMDGAVLKAEVHSENPKTFQDINEYNKYVAEHHLTHYARFQGDPQESRQHFLNQGHDYVQVDHVGMALRDGVFQPTHVKAPRDRDWTDLR